MSSHPSEPATRVEDGQERSRARPWSRFWNRALDRLRRYVRHDDPLAEASNDVALLVGTHLPFWPLYLLWSAGTKTLPVSLLTMTLSPVFCLMPLLTRSHPLAGRVGVVLAGIANTILTCWVLGTNNGTQLFLLPCAALAAISFRRQERVWMVTLGLLPIAVWYGLRMNLLPSLAHFEGADVESIFTLNSISVVVLLTAYGWLQGQTYARMERRPR